MTPAGDGDDRHVLAPCQAAYSAANVVAVEPRQADVEQHDLRPQRLCGFDGRESVVCRPRLVAFHPEQRRERLRGVDIVVDDENPEPPSDSFRSRVRVAHERRRR